MNRAKGFNLLFVGLAAELCVSMCMSADVYVVSEVLRVVSPVAFECRLKNVPDAGPVRWRVNIKGAQASAAKSEAEVMDALRQVLKSGENIELRDAVVRNYFRIEAEVYVESQNIKPALKAGRYIVETELDTATTNPENAEQHPPKDSSVRRVRAVDRPERAFGSYSLPALMRTRIDASSLRSETPLIEALELISGALEPHLPVIVFWSDLQENAFVDRDSPIGVEGFGVMPAAQALDIVLYSVGGSGMPLKFTIDGGVVKIGTLRSLSGKVTRVYSITDLLLPRADFDEDYNGGADGSARGAGGTGRRY